MEAVLARSDLKHKKADTSQYNHDLEKQIQYYPVMVVASTENYENKAGPHKFEILEYTTGYGAGCVLDNHMDIGTFWHDSVTYNSVYWNIGWRKMYNNIEHEYYSSRKAYIEKFIDSPDNKRLYDAYACYVDRPCICRKSGGLSTPDRRLPGTYYSKYDSGMSLHYQGEYDDSKTYNYGDKVVDSNTLYVLTHPGLQSMKLSSSITYPASTSSFAGNLCSSASDCETKCSGDSVCSGYSYPTTVSYTSQQLSLGEDHSCSLLNSGEIKCWGAGNDGQLGTGDNTWRGRGADQMGDNLPVSDLGTGETAKQVAAGDDHTCAILNDDTLKCWGKGSSGMMGQGDTNGRKTPTIVNLGSGKTVKQVSAGRWHTCAILNDDTVKCWGRGEYGKLGYGNDYNRGDGNNEMGDFLPAVNLGTGKTAKQITAGQSHTCAILNDDTVKCWGAGYQGRLGYGDESLRGDAANEMGDNLPTVDLGTGKTAKQIFAGNEHNCVLLNDDTVKCWGRGNNGKLGYGDSNDRGDGAGEMGDNLPVVDLGTGKTVK